MIFRKFNLSEKGSELMVIFNALEEKKEKSDTLLVSILYSRSLSQSIQVFAYTFICICTCNLHIDYLIISTYTQVAKWF